MNFQNLPARSEVVKRAFIPKRGAFSSFDYIQIEPRLFGYFVHEALGDTTIVDWFREGRDFYTEIAGQVYGKPADEVTEDERGRGKVFFLMALYSAGPRKIAEVTGLPYGEAKDFYLQFHDRLPQIRALSNPPPQGQRGWASYKPGVIEQVLQRRKYLKTPWGRHLHPEPWGEHKMLNKLIQGSAADLMKRSLIRVAAELNGTRPLNEKRVGRWSSRMVLTVHDEIVIDGPTDEIESLNAVVPGLMTAEDIAAIVPLGVDHEIGLTNLAEKIKYHDWKETYGRIGAA